MSTITEFIAANLARIEQVAREAEQEHGYAWEPLGPTVRGPGGFVVAKDVGPGAIHIALHDPVHVLAWVAAIRAVVEMHYWDNDRPSCGLCRWTWPCPTLRAIAGIWAGQDGWQEEWR